MKGGSQNPFRVVATVFKNEGVRALYMGCSTLVVGTIAKDALRFVSFDYIRAAFRDPETGSLSATRSLFAGMCSGIVASTFAVTPTERIKTALIDDAKSPSLQDRRFTGSWHAVKVLVKDNGPMAVYRGYLSTTLKQATTTAVRLGTYNIIKEFEGRQNIAQTGLMTFVNGSVVGATTVFTTQPFDTVKTRAQSAKGEGIIEATTGIMKDYGVKGYWKGSTMRLGRNVFSGAILFSVYEEAAAFLRPIFGAPAAGH